MQESLSTLTMLHKRLPTSASRSFFSMFSGVLGYGLPAAAGVALHERDVSSGRKILCLLGDGATQYVVQTFWNAAQKQLPIFFIILKNEKYDILQSFGNYLEDPGVPGFDIAGIDTVKLAEGYGCEGTYVSKPEELEAAIRRGLNSRVPHVLQVNVTANEPPLFGEVGPKTEE